MKHSNNVRVTRLGHPNEFEFSSAFGSRLGHPYDFKFSKNHLK